MENNTNSSSKKREESHFHGGTTSLNLTGELQQGKEFARQLQILLSNPNSSAAATRDFLVHQIISSFDRAVSIAHHSDPLAPPPLAAAKSDSPLSSEDSDPVGDLPEPRTSKAQPRWRIEVQMSPETGFEGPPGDGYNWRKYGQKVILSADYPRAYYRCALKNQTSCSATKQVQRCDKDPSTFEVTYRGLHTCNHPVTNPNPNQAPGKETLISFNPEDNPCFTLQQTTDHFHNQQILPASPNPTGFHFHVTSSGPTTATSAVMPAATTAIGATSSASATSSPINMTQDLPYDPFDFDTSEFFY